MWTGRICLEAASHKDPSWFLTLTYGPDSVPASGSLSARDWRAFSKGIGVRYFGVGEYGGVHGRPHYHAILFGIPARTVGDLVAERWRQGFVSVSAFCRERAQYVAGYVTKKWTKPNEELGDRLPEFSCMSRRPGIGVPGLDWLADWLNTVEGSRYLLRHKDVPREVRIDGRLYPLGQTCVRFLRRESGVPERDPNRVRNMEVRNEVLESEFPDLCRLRDRRRNARYDALKVRAKRLSPGAVL